MNQVQYSPFFQAKSWRVQRVYQSCFHEQAYESDYSEPKELGSRVKNQNNELKDTKMLCRCDKRQSLMMILLVHLVEGFLVYSRQERYEKVTEACFILVE